MTTNSTAAEIERWSFVRTSFLGHHMAKRPDGCWVTYDDHESAVKAAYVKGLEAAREKCVEVFTKANATYRQTRDQHDDGRSSGAEECEQAINQLIKEAKQ